MVDGLRNRGGGCRSGGRLHTHGLTQDRVCQRADIAGHCRAEEQCLADVRHHAADLANVADEPHVEHVVGLVEHEHLDGAQVAVALVDQVQQSAGRRDEHIKPVAQRVDLLPLSDAAEDGERTDVQIPPIIAETVVDLRRKFPGRREHQHAACG